MKTKSLRGRDFLTLRDFSQEEISTFIDLGLDLKRRFALDEKHSHLLEDKSLYMIFYNQSLRTRNSFESGMTQLGGHAHFLSSDKIYRPAVEGDEEAYATERVSDVARVLERYGDGVAIRMYGEATDWNYGLASDYEEEFAQWTDVPILNMECDKYHPCQGLTDVMTMKEKLGSLQDKKFVMSWAYSPSYEKPLSVPHSAIIAASKMGMDVVQAQPEGFDLDDDILDACDNYAEESGGSFEVSYDMDEAFEDADVVYPKCWGAKQEFQNMSKGDDSGMEELFEANKDWKCDQEQLNKAKDNAKYMHCLPADRGFEVSDEVMDGEQSVVFDQAENRLHAQKAVMGALM